MQVSLQVTAICAEPSTWPAGWNFTLTSPSLISSPYEIACVWPAKLSP